MSFLQQDEQMCGWDIIYATKIRSVNETIARSANTPEKFCWQNSDQGYGLQSTFGHWQIGATGQGRLLHLEIPMQSLTIWYDKQMWRGAVTATVQVELHFLPQGGLRPRNDGGITTRLMIRDRLRDPLGDLAQALPTPYLSHPSPAAEVLYLHDGTGHPLDLNPQEVAIIKQGLQAWLQDHLNVFNHAFARISVYGPRTGDTNEMSPNAVSYSFVPNNRSPQDSLLVILCYTKDGSAACTEPKIRADMVPENADVTLMFSTRSCAKTEKVETLFSNIARDIEWANGRSIELHSNKLNKTLQVSGSFVGPIQKL